MTEFTIHTAGMNVKICSEFPSAKIFCTEYLTKCQFDFSITMTSEDIASERQKAAQEDALEGLPSRNFSDAQLEITAIQRKIAEELFAYDTIVFHGSCIAVDGAGYLFTAKSGTGKSTHTRLWREVFGERAVMVNDDKPFLKMTDGKVVAYGSPWMGKHGLGCNMSVPLKAICILERGKENRIQPASPAEVLRMLMQQSQRPQSPANFPKYMELIDRLASGVRFYRMQCNMDPEAARIAYEGMSGK